MKIQTYGPTTPVQRHDDELPSIFLAGPIQGAEDWQSIAAAHLETEAEANQVEFNIFDPRRRDVVSAGDFTEGDYNYQVDWERKHLGIALGYGVVLFWLAEPVEAIEGRAYAQTTRFELGEMFGIVETTLLLTDTSPRICVGLNGAKFSGNRYIRRALKNHPNVLMSESLETVCRDAVLSIKYWCNHD